MPRPLPSDVWALGDALEPLEKLVLLALLDYGRRAFPAQQTLALKTGLSRSTVQRCLDSLRRKGVVSTTSTGKALTYVVDLRPDLRHADASCCVTQTHQVHHTEASDASHRRRDPNESKGTSQTNHQPAHAGRGWEVSWDLRSRISMRDRHAAVDANVPQLVNAMVRHGCPPSEVQGWVEALCVNWARTGEDAYSCFVSQLPGIEVARDTWAFLCARMRKRGLAA